MEALRAESLKVVMAIATASILLGCALAGMNHTVGGASGWDLSSNLQAWTSETAFYVGDSLVFSYTPVHDVVEVGNDGYEACDPSSPVATHNDGETVVLLSRVGPRYFICGRQGHCRMGLKLQILARPATEQRGPGREIDRPPPPPMPQESGKPSLGSRLCVCGVLMNLAMAAVILVLASPSPRALIG